MTSFDSIDTTSSPNCEENLPRIKPARKTLSRPVRHLFKRLSGMPAESSPPKISKLGLSETPLSKRPSFSKWRHRRSVFRERRLPVEVDKLTTTGLQGADPAAAIDATTSADEHLRPLNQTDFTDCHVPSVGSSENTTTENTSVEKMPVRHLFKRLSGMPAESSPPKMSKFDLSETPLSKRPSLSKWRRRRSVFRERRLPVEVDKLTTTGLQGADPAAAIDATTSTDEHLRPLNQTDFTDCHVPSVGSSENTSVKKIPRPSLQVTFRNKIRMNAGRVSLLPVRALKTAPMRPTMMETCQEDTISLTETRSREDGVTGVSRKFTERRRNRRFSNFMSNLARRTSSVPTGSRVPIVNSDDGSSLTSPSDQSMHSDSESNAGSSELFLPPTGAEGFSDDAFLQEAAKQATAAAAADRLTSTTINGTTPHRYRRPHGSTTESDDSHIEEDLENHPPAFDSALSRPPSCTGLPDSGEHPSGLHRAAAKNWSVWLRASISRAARRKTLTAGTSLFNLTPSQGIDYLIKAGVISSNPGAIAMFLTGPDLSCQAIGEYFGRLSDPLATKVTKEFISRMNFEGLELDEALRRMLYRIHPDGESQKMEFLLHNFKESYERQNPARVAEQFRDPETIYTLVYAIVMLHTALYNPSVRRLVKPMTCDQFIANLRGVDAGNSLNEDMLRAIYRRVACNEFKTVHDVMDRLHAVDQTLIGLVKPEAMLQRHRRFIGWTACYEVFNVSGRHKIGSRPTSHLRGLFIFNDMILVTKPVRSYGSHAVSELLGTNILDGSLPRGAAVGSSDGRNSTHTVAGQVSPVVRTHRRLRSLDAFVGGRLSVPPGGGAGETSISVAQQNEILRRNRTKILPGVCATTIPMNSQFHVRQVIPLLDIHVLVFGSGVYANGLELRDQEKDLIYLNLPTEEIRQKVINWVHESIEETSELFRLNVLKDNWLRPAETIPTF